MIKIPQLLQIMKPGDTITIHKEHRYDTSVACSARRAGYKIVTRKVAITGTDLVSEPAIQITLEGFL